MSEPEKLDDKQILSKLANDFHELVNHEEELHSSTVSFLDNVIDELTLGIIFDTHRKFKTNSYDIEMDVDEDDFLEVDTFTKQIRKKMQNCSCPICDRPVIATRFAVHLEGCMGMGRNRPRSTTRREQSIEKEKETTSASSVPSDDDINWSPGSKRGKKKQHNGNKKQTKGNGVAPKKDLKKIVDLTNVEVQIENDLSNMSALEDRSTSPSTDSVSSSQSNASRRRQSIKNKKKKPTRSSPRASVKAQKR